MNRTWKHWSARALCAGWASISLVSCSVLGGTTGPEPPPVVETPVVISLEEVEEAGAEPVIAEDEEIVDLGDDAPEIPPGDDDNAFLEEEEEGEADVTGIVGGDKGEET